MRQKFFQRHWWENQIKYQPFVQRFFLLLSLSPRSPATLNIEPTNFCNLDCAFCPIKKTNRAKGFMELRLYRKIIDQINREKKLKVLWLNKDGEPLMHPKIDKMVEYGRQKNVADRIEIYTNGLLLDGVMAKKLIMAGLDSLVVSLDATSRESFKKLKKKDVYKQVVANIHDFLKTRSRFKAQKPLLSVKMVDLGDLKEIKNFKKFWEGIADCVIIQPLHNWEGSMKKLFNCSIVQLFNSLVARRIPSVSALGDEPPLRRRRSSATTNEESPSLCAGGGFNCQRYPCNLPWLAPAINWDGTVVPCCVNYRKNELILGNVKKNSLKEIFQGEKFRALRQAHLRQDFSQFPTCARCQFWRQLPNMDFRLRRLGA